AKQCLQSNPRMIPDRGPFKERMLELQRGLVVKILVEVAQSDWHWTENEYGLARELFEHCWGRRLNRAELKEALKEVCSRASEISWASLFRPFAEFPVLRKRIGELETIVLRIGNLVAKIDGVWQITLARWLRKL
ncbi:MAG TPA: hypothetical protein VHE33_17340, partial [Acidobacteriaceae bacterium]|nr:hypothetical protein [Acidobacteriaceae bacterium]